MKVAILTNSYPPNLNGVSRSVVNLEKSLQNLGVEVFIITPKVPEVIYQKNVLPLSSYSAPQKVSSDLQIPYNYIDQSVRFIKKNQIDILHSQDTLIGGVEAVIIAMKCQIPCVHTYHTMVEDYDYFSFPGYKTFIRRYSQAVCDGYDAVVAVSPKTEQYLRQINVQSPIYQIPNVLILPTNKQINSSKFQNSQLENQSQTANETNNSEKNTEQNLTQTSIQNSALQNSNQPKNFTRSPTSNPTLQNTKPFKEKFPNLPPEVENSFNFVTFGRIAKEKSLEIGIEILEPLLQKYPIHYLISGIGPEMENLQKFIKSKNLENKVFLIGKYDSDTLTDFCDFCDVFVNTSTSENLPTTDFEALSFGLPVVAVDDLAHRFFVNNADLSFLEKLESLEYLENKTKNDEKNIEKNKLQKSLNLEKRVLNLEKRVNNLTKNFQNEFLPIENQRFGLQSQPFTKFLDYIKKTQNKIEIQNQKTFQNWFLLTKPGQNKKQNRPKINSSFNLKISSKFNTQNSQNGFEQNNEQDNFNNLDENLVLEKIFVKEMNAKLENWINKNQIWINKNQIWINKNFPKIAKLIKKSQENENWQIRQLNPNIWEKRIKLSSKIANKNITNLDKLLNSENEQITLENIESKNKVFLENVNSDPQIRKNKTFNEENNEKIMQNKKNYAKLENLEKINIEKLPNGFCVELSKMTLCCEKLYLDNDLRWKLRQNAQKTAQTLAKRPVELEYLDLYKKLIEQSEMEKLENKKFGLIFENFEELVEKLQYSWQNWFQK